MEVQESKETLTVEEAKKQGLDGAVRDILAKYGAKEAGTFISYGKDGKVIREYPDGRKTEV
ncbi:hypothetical protein Q8G81_35820, partial [Klebsiella pneumoniae]